MIELTGRTLTIDQVSAIGGGAPVTLSEDARRAVSDGERTLARMVADGNAIYGITTGVGALDGCAVPPDANRMQQRNLLKSHASGVGAPMADDAVRAMMGIRANVLASGATGVRLETVESLLAMLNAGIVPQVPEQGSVGACGDLAPLAHMALPLIGLGQARFDGAGQDGAVHGDVVCGGVVYGGGDVLRMAGIPLPDLAGRDGLALINGTEQTTAIGCLAAAKARRLIAWAEAAATLVLEALGALTDSFDERVALAKPHAGQIAASAALRRLSEGSTSVGPPRPNRLRDALALRCIPQVMGAVRDALDTAEKALEIEINAVNDNPIFAVADGWVTSNSGNFHGHAVAEVLDYLANTLTSLAVMSERRSARLIDGNLNGGLPPFLIHTEATTGLNSGFMIAQYTAAALVAELRTRAIPAAIQSIPTCANTEDHVPMSPLAARRAAFAVETAAQIVAIEVLLAAQAVDLRGLTPAPALRPFHGAVRARVPTMREDRILGDDIAAVVAVMGEMNPP